MAHDNPLRIPEPLRHDAGITTPYILLKPGIHEWQAYLRRTLPDAPKQARIDANERHMKYGPTRTYWNDFVFERYLNYRTEAIYLAGLPDLPESRCTATRGCGSSGARWKRWSRGSTAKTT